VSQTVVRGPISRDDIERKSYTSLSIYREHHRNSFQASRSLQAGKPIGKFSGT
jgi:hypothetical protein